MLTRIRRALLYRHSTDHFWRLREKLTRGRRGLLYYIRLLRYNGLMRKHGCMLPLASQFDGRPSFPHGLNGIFISTGAVIGRGVTIFHQVTIGSNAIADSKGYGAPIIGDNVYIGVGAKIIGGVTVGSGSRIGANAVVFRDVPPNSTVVLPEPRIITHEVQRDNTFVVYNKEEQYV